MIAFYIRMLQPADDVIQAARASAQASAYGPFRPTPATAGRFFAPIQARFITDQVRTAIDKAVGSAPVVLFMKGTPDTPQCGFSRASVQILGLQGVDPGKFAAFNVLEDQALREGEHSISFLARSRSKQ